MQKSNIYKNAPLMEAVFELFYHTNEWSPVIPGLFFNEIKNIFPKSSHVASGVGLTFDKNGVKVDANNSGLTQYKSANEDTVIQLSDRMLTVNKLPKYISWESYFETIQLALRSLMKVLKIENVNRIGLKAVNKIDVKEHNLDNLKKYFDIYPHIPYEISKENSTTSYNITYEFPIKSLSDIIAISLISAKKEEKYIAPVVLVVYALKIDGIKIDSIDDWIFSAHENVKKTFENCITDYARSLFK